MIANKTKFTYSKHAKDEWIRDEHGFIRHYPKTFILTGCKSISQLDENKYKVTYRYCDRTDLIIICDKNAFVITNYRSLNLNNKNNFKGTFYVTLTSNRVGVKVKRKRKL